MMANVWAKKDFIFNHLGKYKELVVACDKAIQIVPPKPGPRISRSFPADGK